MKLRLLMYTIFMASLALSSIASASTLINFETTVQSGDFTGTIGTGTLSYDDTILDGSGYGYFYPNDPSSFNLSFNVFGQTFTTVNDADFPDYPEFEINNFELDYLSFLVSESGPNNTSINKAGIDAFLIDSFFTLGNDGIYRGDLYVDGVVVSAVPVPAAAWLFGTGLLGLIGFSRRKKNKI